MLRLLPFLLLCGCGPATNDVLHSYGLAETSRHRDLAVEAAALANQVLGSVTDMTLALHWQPLGARTIPIYWVGSRNLSQTRTDMMFVLDDCQCIVAQPAVFLLWLSEYSGSSSDELLDLSEISAPNLLALFLLHETGHILEGHPGRAIGADTRAYTLDRNVYKDRETAADTYAAAALRTAGSNSEDFERWWAARSIIGQVGNLAFNLTGIRLVDNFGATSLALPDLFLDQSTSHPNFESRILEINHLIHDNDYTRAALVDFYAHQHRSSDQAGAFYPRTNADQVD